MALEIADRVKETTTTTSTGTYTLAGAVDGFQSFATVGDGNTTYYACTDGTDYEVGVGSYTASGTTLSRVTILESSNSDAAVNWGAGTKEIFVTVPAEKYLVRDASGNVSLTGNLSVSGTVDGRDVSADGSKLDGIESGATADQTAAQIRAKVEAASDSNVFTDADHAKLNGIEANAKDDQTITAGSGLTGGGTGNVTLSHADTSSQASVNGSGRTYIQDITLDTYGHVTGLATATETVVNTDTVPNNATITITAGNALTGGGNFTTDQASNETITINHQDTSSQASVNNSGRTYIQDITLDSYGHVTGISSATETVTNTNTNQLTTFQLEDGDGTEVTISHGKEVKFVEGGAIDINWTDTSNGTDGDPYDLTFAHADTSSQGSVNNSNGTVIQDVTLDGYGHVTALGSVNLDNRYTLKDHIRSIGTPAFTGGTNPNITTAQLVTEMENDGSFDSYSSVFKTSWSYAGNYNLTDAGGFTETAGTSWLTWTDNSSDSTRGNITALAIAPNTGGSAGGVFIYNDQGSSYSPGWREVWTSMTDGSGSGLDADLLDGQHGSYYYPASNPNGYTTNVGDITGVTAGGGLTGGGTSGGVTLSHADTSSQSSVNNSGRTYIQDITLDGYGHVTGITSATETVTDTNTNRLTTFQVEDGDGTEVTISHGKEWKFVEAGGININWTDTSNGSDSDPYDLSFNISTSITAGGGLTGGGQLNANRTISHADTSSQASVNNSGRTYIQDITLDTYGHITGITSATETVTNTNQLTTFQVEDGDGTEVTISHGKEWKFVEGGGIDINWTDTSPGSDADPYDLTFTHADTSSQASVNNSGGTVIQDVTLDGYGHVTGLTSYNLDGRYYTETESDSRYMKKNGDSHLDMNNYNITNINHITINDPGPGEGIEWLGGNGWEIYESPNNLTTNGAGNLQFVTGTTRRATIDTSGNFEATGNVNTSSDARLKDNVTQITDALDKIGAIRGVTYNRNDIGGNPRQAGVIAQEVEAVLPEVVWTGDDGYKSVAYGNMVGLLIEAIKEQQTQIDALTAQVKELKR